MSFGASQTKLPHDAPAPLGQQTQRASTAENARPVPYLAGRQRLGVTFITDVWNQKAVAVTSQVGKGPAQVQGYNYYASFAALICHGALDEFHDLFYNSDSVYAGNTKILPLSLTLSGDFSTAIFQTRNPHGLSTGDGVFVVNAKQSVYNGDFNITVIDPTHFSYPVLGAQASDTPATGNIYARVKLNPVVRDGTHPVQVPILVPNFGPVTVLWGTEQQPMLTALSASGIRHPSMRGVAIQFFDQSYLGFNQTNVQNIEVIVARFPKAEWHDIAAVDGECNPIAFICDILQNPRAGCRMPTSRIDTATMLDTATKLHDEGFGFSPLITRQQQARQIILQALEYFDGYISVNASGQIGVKLARGEDLSDVPTIQDSDLVSPPSLQPEDWDSIKTGVNVRFLNRDVGYNPDMAMYRDPAALRILSSQQSIDTLDRLWITKRDVAQAVATYAGRAAALPSQSGTVKLRNSNDLYSQLPPGAMFAFDLSKRSFPNTFFRVVERSWTTPSRPEFEITFKLDRSYLHT